MRAISFSYNWNKKLDCQAFTTIRLYQPEKYVVGETYEILLKDVAIGKGEIVEIRKFMLSELNEFVAYLDTGYPKEKCKEIIRKMYPKVDFERQILSLILIKKTTA